MVAFLPAASMKVFVKMGLVDFQLQENTKFQTCPQRVLPLSLSPRVHGSVTANWQPMRKSDIRYPRATTDPGPLEGHIATEMSSKGRRRGGRAWACKGKGHGLHRLTIPAAAVALVGTSLPSGKLISSPLDWHPCYGDAPWQLAEPTGFQERGGRLCVGS